MTLFEDAYTVVIFCFVLVDFYMLERYFKRVKNKGLVIMLLVAVQAALALIYPNDHQLEAAYTYDGGASLPYSKLWFFVSPQWWTNQYLVWLLVWQFAGLCVLLFMWRKDLVSFRWVYWCQALNFLLVFVHNPQSVIPMQFVYLAPLCAPLFLAAAAMFKFPVLWPAGSDHVQCFLGNIHPVYVWNGFDYYNTCDHLFSNPLVGHQELDNWFVYIVIGWMCYRALMNWWDLQRRLSN